MTGVRAAVRDGAATAGPAYAVVARARDVVAALALLVAFAPVMALAAIAIRLTSSGPAIFRQERVGRHGRRFTLYKFRTMRAGADQSRHRRYVQGLIEGGDATPGAGEEVFKLADDDRVTGVGRLLRRYSLDELPQLLNVVAGDMSLVGPRPALPYEVELYGQLERRRLAVKPGLTGLWQVSGRNLLSMRRMFELDAQYVDDQSLALDLSIMVRTPREMLRPSGAR